MNTKLFNLINSEGETIIIQASIPELAMIKAGRLGELGWSITDELSADDYCYKTLQRALSREYDELTDELYHYFKSRMEDRHYSAYLHADCIENLIGIRDYDDIVEYVMRYYNYC